MKPSSELIETLSESFDGLRTNGEQSSLDSFPLMLSLPKHSEEIYNYDWIEMYVANSTRKVINS